MLVDDVQLYAVPENVKRLELQVLVPQTTAQLNFAGGLKLPGKIRKWSSLDPPEIRAAVVGAEKMSISLWDLGDERAELERWTDSVSAMVRPTADLDLDDGDYEVELEVNGSVVSVSTLRLRSADAPDLVSWETCASLNYEVGLDPLGALTASEVAEHGPAMVDGLSAVGAFQHMIEARPVGTGQFWASKKSGQRTIAPPIVLGHADPKSCVVTGAHHMEFPLWMGGRSKGEIQGVCKYCGLTKMSPASPKWKKPAGHTQATAPRFDLVSTATDEDLGASWDHCLDALVHVGGGTIGALDRIAAQAEGSSLFVDQFLRTLEGLGHIDVRRDDRLQPVEWEANPSFVAETSRGSFVLAGVWSESLRNQVGATVGAAGGALCRESSENALSVWTIEKITHDQLASAVAASELDVYVVDRAVDRMLDALPPLSAVEGSLTMHPIPDYSKASVFDLDQASWVPVPGVATPGAYRLEQSFRSTTIWVSGQGAVDRTARVGTIHLVKHLAARASGQPLLATTSRRRRYRFQWAPICQACTGGPQCSVRASHRGSPDRRGRSST